MGRRAKYNDFVLQRKIVDFIYDNGSATTNAVARHFEIAGETARKALEDLKKTGQIFMGVNKWPCYNNSAICMKEEWMVEPSTFS